MYNQFCMVHFIRSMYKIQNFHITGTKLVSLQKNNTLFNSDFNSMSTIPFHIALRRARIRKNITQEQIAQQLHISQASYNRCESGRQKISIRTFMMLLILFSDDKEFQKEAAAYQCQLFIKDCQPLDFSQEEIIQNYLPTLLENCKNHLQEVTTATQKDKE